jgi:DNA-binding SARP family transcriptional activator
MAMGQKETATPPTTGVALAVLGELKILVDGQLVPLRRKDRAMLAYLAITGQPQRRSTLVDLFFQEAEDPAAAFRLGLSRIRSQLGPSILQSSQQQVRLVSTGLWFDFHLFDELLGEHIPICSDDNLAAAVDLVQGPLLDRLAIPSAPEFELWLLGERARVQRRVGQALQQLSDRAAAAGQFDTAIIYGRALVAASPLLEEAHARLIRLYSQTGQIEAALAQFEQCHDILVRELAVAPGRELTELREALNTGNGAMLFHPLPVVVTLPQQPGSGLYEREHELARLHTLWEQASTGQGAVVLLVGEAGAGKSRLLREFVRDFSAKQLQLGVCSELAQKIPYEPWIELLEGRLSVSDVAALPRLWRDYLLRLLPGLAAQVAVEVPPLPPTAGGELERLFAAVAEALIPAGVTPQVVVIEDLHWADEASLQLFAYLARRVANRSIVLIGSMRPEEPSAHPLLASLHEDIKRLGATVLPIKPLSEAAVIAIADRLLGNNHRSRVAELGSLIRWATGGNALFVTELLRELASYETLANELPIPGSVRELINRRLVRLPDGERQVLEAVAVLGTPTTLDEAADISARSIDEVASAFDRGLHWGLLMSDTASPSGSYRFSHHLPREAVVAQLSLARRQILHRRVAERIERSYANQPHEARVAIAERLLRHAYIGDAPQLLVRWALLAAERAWAIYAYSEALVYLDMGLSAYKRLMSTDASQAYREVFIEFLLRRILLLDTVGKDIAIMQQHLDDAAAQLTAQHSEFLQVLYHYCRAVVLGWKPDYATASHEALLVHERFLQLGERRLAALCLLRASRLLATISRNHEAHAAAIKALALYTALDEHDGQHSCRVAIGIVTLGLGRYQEARDHFEAMLQLANEQQSMLHIARAHFQLGTVAHTLYQSQRVIYHMQQAINCFKQLDMPGRVVRCKFFIGIAQEVATFDRYGLTGNYAPARAIYSECWEESQATYDNWLSGWVAQVIGRRAYWEGDVPTARLWLERSTAIRHAAGEVSNQRNDLAWMGRLALAEGDPQQALAHTSEAIDGLAEASKEFYVFETPDLYLTHAMALAATGAHAAAEDALAQALNELDRVAQQLRDPEERNYYLYTSPLAWRVRLGIGGAPLP